MSANEGSGRHLRRRHSLLSALQLSGVRSALTAMVSARRQWMILSVVVSVGTDSVGCWKTTVSEMMTADVEDLMSLWHR